MSSAAEDALAMARRFVEWDVNSETTAEASEALAANRGIATPSADFLSSYGSRLEFGTAGLRAAMGPGFGRMNDLTVVQAAQGLVAHLDAAVPGGHSRGIVVGYDHRALGSLNSRRFAVLTAIAAASRGWRVFLMDRFTLTPLVPFGIVHLGAAAGVMVTASHNPTRDNGYKVYWGNGAQIISPVDAGIAAAIADTANQVPWPALRAAYHAADEEALRAGTTAAASAGGDGKPWGDVLDQTDALIAAYIAAVKAQLCVTTSLQQAVRGTGGEPPLSFPVRIAYTAMHGVGTPFAMAMFAAFGLPPFTLTPEQCSPNPEFPTVAFPNPEEGKGALALAMATAARAGATLILANDPDADRLAVAEWAPAAAADVVGCEGGEWRVYTGNEIAALLAWWAWERHMAAGGRPSEAVMVASTVSSKLCAAMAAQEGFAFEECLTGFKWMGNAMARHSAEAAATAAAGGGKGRRVIFSFEEAIGFSCGDVVRDKDGVSAAAVFAEMAHELARRGLTTAQQLQLVYARYGLHLTRNAYVFVDRPDKTAAIFARLRNEGHYWARLGRGAQSLAIASTRDLTGEGWDSTAPGGVPRLPTSSGTQMLTYTFGNGVVATLRTSGTEPKLKYYCEIKGDAAQPAAARAELDRTVELLLDEMLQPERYGLKR